MHKDDVYILYCYRALVSFIDFRDFFGVKFLYA